MEARVADHFVDMEQQSECASLGMWAFLVTEMLFFGGMFAGYTVYRLAYPQAFEHGSQHMDVLWGTVNTGVLLLSSFTMALSVHASQTDRQKRLFWLLVATAILGVVFICIKGYEYYNKYQHHHIPGINWEYHGPDPNQTALFFFLYFVMTAIHALHLAIGIGLVGYMAWRARKGNFSSRYHIPIEVTGLYWHFVDVIWIYLFPLFYLIGTR